MTWTRRRFLGATAAASAGALLGCRGGDDPAAGPPTTTSRPAPATEPAAAPGRGRRALVLVQLGGGNDGLNSLVLDDGRYRDLRPTLAIPEADVVALAGFAGGLHPALGPLVASWDAGELAFVDGLGHHHADRSHFACRQHWWDGTEPGAPSTTGWLGRWLDATAPGGEADPLRAVGLGSTAPMLRAVRSSPTIVLDPASFGITAGSDPDALAAGLDRAAAGRTGTDLVARAAAATTAALAAAADLRAPLAAAGAPAERTLTGDLGLAAELLAADIGIEVLVVGAEGFDTHADQAARQAVLLGDLATGLVGFRERLAAAGRLDDVLVLTTSEFGRRVAENGSGGTDHGHGNVQLLLGSGVAGGAVVGAVDLGALEDGDVLPTIDPRSCFATALDWLGGPTDEVLEGHEDLGLLR